MVVTKNTTAYIKTSSGDDFCPKNVFIFPMVGPIYTTGDITTWYDYYKTNGRKHRLKKCRTVRPVEQKRRRRRSPNGLKSLKSVFDLIGNIKDGVEWGQILGIIPESDIPESDIPESDIPEKYECIE